MQNQDSQRGTGSDAMPSANPRGHRQQHSEESWVEIGSRPSSSSLSSVADEIITTGLRVQHDSNMNRRRRRSRSASQFVIGTGHGATTTGGGSSQEEYEESESESDRVMTSSSEAIIPSISQNQVRRPSGSPYSVASSETMSEREDDDDENATAVNYPRSSRPNFEPRPNAFSHPANAPAVREQSGTTYVPRRPANRPASQRHSFPQHSPYNAISPHYQPDHDAALRASLSTLLSAAAAVRGLPKPGQPRTHPINQSTRLDPTSLRLVPESVALGNISEDAASSPRLPSTASPSASPPRTATTFTPADKAKQKAGLPVSSTARSTSSKERRAIKKVKKTGPLVDDISPTLLTWIVSAGVVVLVSALSFSAGYVVGKEAGHAEAMGQLGAVGAEAGSCGKEATSGLRRLRWSGGSGVRV